MQPKIKSLETVIIIVVKLKSLCKFVRYEALKNKVSNEHLFFL